MARPTGGYFTKTGERVPSVTTVISKFRDPGALMFWSAGQTAEYIKKNLPETPTRADVLRLCEVGRSAFRDVRDAEAEAGTLAHAAVEANIRKLPFVWPPDSDVVRRARKAYGAFLEWADQTRLTITHTEVSLVSEVHKFGGTMDGATMNNKRGVIDWKTSGSCYPEFLIQVAAYWMLWEEHFPDDLITGGAFLARFDKTHGDFGLHWWGELESAKRAFLLMRELYEISETLKKRSK